MYYYPIFLNITGKKCVVIGGGNVAERRIKELIKCGATVHVYAKEFRKNILKLKKNIKIYQHYSRRIIKGASLLFIATDDRNFNRKILKDIDEKIPVNVSDDPQNCSFIVPSLLRRGDLTIAISTSGKAPSLSRALRKLFERQFGKEFVLLLNGIESLRMNLRKRLNKSADRIRILRDTHLEELLHDIADSNTKQAKKHIYNYLEKEKRKIEKILRG